MSIFRVIAQQKNWGVEQALSSVKDKRKHRQEQDLRKIITRNRRRRKYAKLASDKAKAKEGCIEIILGPTKETIEAITESMRCQKIRKARIFKLLTTPLKRRKRK
jgi:putative protein kinase ArgK-like GTPase of G3E family